MFVHEGAPLGVLWIAVDQAGELRKTHGARACETMLESVERTLANGLRPGEEIGRWGDDEFLILSHERSPEVLASHAQVLAGLARTADFRWWGDRVSLTVSVGAAAARRARHWRRYSTGRKRVLAASSRRQAHAQRPAAMTGDRQSSVTRTCGGEAAMFAIIGILLVFGAVIGGFLMEKGQILVLLQPAELLIIAGAAMGTLLVANPMHILKGIVARTDGRGERIEIRQGALPEHPEDDVPVPEQGAQRRAC